jgi:hypothetical protein
MRAWGHGGGLNLSIAYLTLRSSLSLAPFLVDRPAIFTSVNFAKSFGPLYHSSHLARLQIVKSSFHHFQTSVIHITSLLISFTTFEHQNTTRDGGAFTYDYPDLEIEECLFRSNRADRYGGAVYISSPITTADISSSNFLDNKASTGGALYCSCWDCTITSTLFDDNSASDSGAIAIWADYLTISSSSFRFSVCNTDMASVTIQNDFELSSCTFYANDGPFLFKAGRSTSISIDSCCFADGEPFLKFEGDPPSRNVSIKSSCFNSTEKNASSGNWNLDIIDSSFGGCDQCYYSQETPAPTATLRSGIGEVPVMVAVIVSGVFLIVAIVGIFVLKNKCVIVVRRLTMEGFQPPRLDDREGPPPVRTDSRPSPADQDESRRSVVMEALLPDEI